MTHVLPVTCNIAATIRAPTNNTLVDFTCTFTFYDEDVLRCVHHQVTDEIQLLLDRLFPGSSSTSHVGILQ
jgi:hypothetical protein